LVPVGEGDNGHFICSVVEIQGDRPLVAMKIFVISCLLDQRRVLDNRCYIRVRCFADG